MKIFTCIFIITLFIQSYQAQGQLSNCLADSLNHRRIVINSKGLKVLAAEGIASLGVGAVGYFPSTNKETKSFFEMTAFWGLVNTGIAGAGLIGAKKELAQKLSCRQAADKYRQTKNLYLINSGLDVIYIGTGAFLIHKSNHTQNNPETLSGFGKAIALQGILLFVFDQVMYNTHRSNCTKWEQVINGVCITNNGIGYRYAF